jgi:hypothetical protein
LTIRREDVVAALFQAWLFFMSVTALVTQSIPHLGASFTLHVMALGWSAFQTWATQKFNGDYQYIISGPQGACPGIDFISGYFTMRATFQVGTTVVNFVSMIASAYLCWRLFDVSNVALMRGHNEFSLFLFSDLWVGYIQEDGRWPHDCACL